jgi:hypothetical protein
MGASWVKFKVRADADPAQIRKLAAFIRQQYPLGTWLDPPADFSMDEAKRVGNAIRQLERMLVFPKEEIPNAGYWDFTELTDPPGSGLTGVVYPSKAVPGLDELDQCRVDVISNNPIFPIEWRDEAYRIILPEDLTNFLHKWRIYLKQVRGGHWQQYLHELYLYDRVSDDHQSEKFETLARFAVDSLSCSNAWCRKEQFGSIRDRILQFNPVERIKKIRQTVVRPKYDEARLERSVSPQQLQKEEEYWDLRQKGALLIQEWNRLVPKKRKVQYPIKETFDDFLANAESNWLKNFFAWCEFLIGERYGLFHAV